jgi:hypothetical protein
MLFFVHDTFIEIVKESCYKDVVTVCGSSMKALAPFRGLTLAEPVRLQGQNHKWALHVPESQIPSKYRNKETGEFEEIDRLTGPAKAYVFDYVYQSALDRGGDIHGEYGFCWPENIQATEKSLYECEEPAADGVTFVPIWFLPDELTGAPRKNQSLGSGDDGSH